MRSSLVLDLAACTEFRQNLEARPPRIVHATAGLLALLLGALAGWLALTEADLVVRAAGRVRPATSPEKVFNAARGEVLGAGAGGRVAEVRVREGDAVRQGDLLVRLETDRLDNDIARARRALRAAEDELETTTARAELVERQFEAARAKARAELEQERTQVRRARLQQEAEIRLLQVELETASDDEGQLRALVARRAAAVADLTRATLKTREAREKLARAHLAVDESRLPVAEQALALLEQDYALKRQEQQRERATHQARVDAARLELAGRELERTLAEIRSPADGTVIKGDLKVGDVLEPGKTVLELAPLGTLLFEGSVKSEDVAHLRLGMPVRLQLDAYDHQRYGTLDGAVCFLAPDSALTAEPRRTEYTVRIRLHSTELRRGAWRGQVKLGMAGQALIITGRESLLGLFLKRLRQSISLT
jgi:multidrug resistance efflux pump